MLSDGHTRRSFSGNDHFPCPAPSVFRKKFSRPFQAWSPCTKLCQSITQHRRGNWLTLSLWNIKYLINYHVRGSYWYLIIKKITDGKMIDTKILLLCAYRQYNSAVRGLLKYFRRTVCLSALPSDATSRPLPSSIFLCIWTEINWFNSPSSLLCKRNNTQEGMSICFHRLLYYSLDALAARGALGQSD